MARIEKTVFISYRRTDVYTALAVYENLKNQGYDVFFDYTSISSGDFEQIITSNIRARAHFLLILTPTALDRCNEPDDWLRREIEFAIDEKRNIVPLFFRGFRFGTPSVSEKLTGKLKNLSRYNALNVHEDYFGEAMQRLSTQFLNKPLETVLHPVSTEVQEAVRAEQVAADKALEKIEDVQELAKQSENKPVQLQPAPDSKEAELERLKKQAIRHELMGDFWDALQVYYSIRKLDPLFPGVDVKIGELQKELRPRPVAAAQVSRGEKPAPKKAIPWRLVGAITGGLALIALLIWGGVSLLSNPPNPPNRATGKDGMTLLYVPAGTFTMGSESSDDEKPIHEVTLDAFWIDQTEVTNAMYARCVADGVCEEPADKKSWTRSSYYDDPEFDNYPVIYVDWNMAKTYCEWAGRRLPTEAEWEKAARGENANVYPWGNETPDNSLLNYKSEVGDTTEVGKYPDGASIYGALDMAGNVWEWVSSLYQPYPYDVTDGRENLDSSPAARLLRGGSWTHDEDGVRSANRFSDDPTATFNYVGFRCAVSDDQRTDSKPLVQALNKTAPATQTTQPTLTDTPAPTQTTTVSATPTPSIGSTMTGKDGMTLLYVPASEFTMGSDNGESDEKPVHKVSLVGFWIDQTEVTNAMYSRCIGDGVCNPPDSTGSATRQSYIGNPEFDNYPVIYVSWKDANDYCTWVNRRVPTEAEWEKAARGTDGRTYPWGDDMPNNDLLNYNNTIGDTTEVGKYPNGASPYGALDMAGNAWEWVADWYKGDYDARGIPLNKPNKILRGGSWFSLVDNIVRSTYRFENYATHSSIYTGFRCAMSATP